MGIISFPFSAGKILVRHQKSLIGLLNCPSIKRKWEWMFGNSLYRNSKFEAKKFGEFAIWDDITFNSLWSSLLKNITLYWQLRVNDFPNFEGAK